MASQPLYQSFTPPMAIVPRPNVRVAFAVGTAMLAIRDKIASIPEAYRTLDELAATDRRATMLLEIGADTDALIASAKNFLSSAMFAPFLAWGEAASRLDGAGDDEEERSRVSDPAFEAVRTIARTHALTGDDFMFKAWIAALEASDSPVMGPLRIEDDGERSLIADTIAGIIPDLDAGSNVTRGLDQLAYKSWSLSATKLAIDADIANAIGDAFARARSIGDVAPPAAGMFNRGEIADLRSRFMRGPLAAWEKAYARFREDEIELRRMEADPATGAEEIDRVADWKTKSLIRLLLGAAPSPAALAVKLKLFQEEEAWELTSAPEITAAMSEDARRFAKHGPYLQADRELLAAFASYRARLVELASSPDDDDAQELACYARMDPASETMLSTPAQTIEGVLAKLRHGLMILGPDIWVPDVVVNPTSSVFAEGIAMEGIYERLLWGAFKDLARIAGVNLAEQEA